MGKTNEGFKQSLHGHNELSLAYFLMESFLLDNEAPHVMCTVDFIV